MQQRDALPTRNIRLRVPDTELMLSEYSAAGVCSFHYWGKGWAM